MLGESFSDLISWTTYNILSTLTFSRYKFKKNDITISAVQASFSFRPHFQSADSPFRPPPQSRKGAYVYAWELHWSPFRSIGDSATMPEVHLMYPQALDWPRRAWGCDVNVIATITLFAERKRNE